MTLTPKSSWYLMYIILLYPFPSPIGTGFP